MALARPLVAASPAAVAPRFVLAAALRRCGDLAASRTVLEPLLTPTQGAWGVFYETGMIAAGLHDTAVAIDALRTAVRLNPASSLAAHALAGQQDLVGDRCATAVDASPTAAALALLDGDAAPLAALGLFTNDIAVATIVAAAGLQHGRFAEVAALLTTALAVTPGYLPARLTLATALFRLDRADEAQTAVSAVLATAPASRTARSLRAAIAMAAGDVAAARDNYAALTTSDGDDAVAWHALGHARRAAGDAAGAVAAYRRALAAAPHFAEVWWSLANLKTVAFTPSDHAAMTALLAGDLSSDDRASLHFALGKADDDAGRPGRAFAHYAAGNAVQRALTGFDRAAHRAFVDRTIATLTPAFFAARAGRGDASAEPIFIVGLPRSGSTLVEQILGSHPAVEGLSELPDVTVLARGLGGPYPEVLADLAPADFARLGSDYLAGVAPRRQLGRARFVDKFPGNVLHLGLIQLMLPKATIIDVRRGAVATCWSLFKQRFAGGQAYASDLGDLGHYYTEYLRLMDHAAAVLPGRVLTLSYEALVDDTETQVRRLLAHAGLPFDPACLAFYASDRVVRTPSSEQVRQPIFRSGLDDWRRFAPWLGPLFAALGPLAAER